MQLKRTGSVWFLASRAPRTHDDPWAGEDDPWDLEEEAGDDPTAFLRFVVGVGLAALLGLTIWAAVGYLVFRLVS